MGVLYKPFSIIAGIIGKRAGRNAFAKLWANVGDGEVPPAPSAGHRQLGSVFATAALQAAILAGIGAVVDQLAARAFHQIFGAWPDQKLKNRDVTPKRSEDPDPHQPAVLDQI